jgi:hypothetical protein
LLGEKLIVSVWQFPPFPLSPFLDIKFINIQRRKRKKEGGVRGWQKSKKVIENLLA